MTPRTLLAASAGNALEFYDFTIFGFFAPQIAAAFFPANDQAAGLLLTFGTYGVSFLARPVGAAMLGGYGDRHGRRAALTLTILLMTIGTLMLAAMPGYAAIGRWAGFGILAARLIQGFSTGGEFGAATAFMVEHAGGRRAGFFGSFQFISQSLASIAASGVAWALTASLGPHAMGAWGFRIPLALGLLIGPVGWYVRRHVAETPLFAATAPHPAPARHLLVHYPGRLLLGAGVIAGGTAANYLTNYLPTYVHIHLHKALTASYAITFISSLAPLCVTPFAAALSDRAGRLPIILCMVALLALIAWPLILLVIAHPSGFVLAAVFITMNAVRAAYSAPIPALLAEMFPTGVRSTGLSLAYTLGVVVFGGFAQLIMEWLIGRTGNLAVPGLYVAVCAAVSLAALLTIARRIPRRL